MPTEKKGNANPQKSITAKQWKDLGSKTHIITLPSGANVEVKNLNLLECAASGHIPLKLLNQSTRMAEKMGQADGGMNEDELKGMLDIIDSVTLIAVINPRISKEKKENTILLSDIPTNDRMAIFEFVNSTKEATVDLSSFPEGR